MAGKNTQKINMHNPKKVLKPIKSILSKAHRIISNNCSCLLYKKNVRKADIILIDTPIHGNLGDQAISIAEIQILNENFPQAKILEVSANHLDSIEEKYAQCTPTNKLIIVHGGGFLGDLWPAEELRFRRCVDAFKNHELIVLPQTISFKNYDNNPFYEESKIAYSKGNNLCISCREQNSFKIMEKYFPNINSIKIPDSVLLLKSENRTYNRKNAILCFREDCEKNVSNSDINRIKQEIRTNFNNSQLVEMDTVINRKIKKRSRKYYVNKILSEFCKAKIVITDRLHGMVFAAITNTPCIAMGNINGKVKGVYEWLKENEFISYIDDISQFKEVYTGINLDKEYHYSSENIKKEYGKLIKLIMTKMHGVNAK